MSGKAKFSVRIHTTQSAECVHRRLDNISPAPIGNDRKLSSNVIVNSGFYLQSGHSTRLIFIDTVIKL